MNLSLGFTLMLIGMVTVFVIMFLIIFIIQELIQLVNRFAPAKETADKSRNTNAQDVDALTMSIIADTVRQITGGSGTVKTVRKI